MNWAWASSLDQIWNLPTVPMWITLGAAGFFGLVVLITLLRAEKSVANGTLTVVTLLAVGVAAAATIRGYGPPGRGGSGETRSSSHVSYAALPALSCIDDLAGDTVLSACEKVLFGSAESTAAAVAYTASQVTRLTTLGDAAVANKNIDSRTASAAASAGTRPLWPGRASAAGAGSLHADAMRGLPLAHRSAPDRIQYGRAHL